MSLEPDSSKKNVLIEKNFSGLLPNVILDQRIVTAALQNLLSNAVKYSFADSHVKLKIVCDRKESLVVISVVNQGPGIPKSFADKIFSKFSRGDNIVKFEPEGTGLGLYVVKSMIGLVDGRIGYRSEENKETTFFVEIPLGKKVSIIKKK